MPEKINGIIFSLKEALTHATIYHYGTIALTLLIAILFFSLAILLRKKLWLFLILFLLSLFTLFAGPFISFNAIDAVVRKLSFSKLEIQQLVYVDDIIVRGVVTNNGKVPISQCTITASRSKTSQNEWLKLGYSYTKLSSETTKLPMKLNIGESQEFKISLPGRLKSGETVYIQGNAQ